MVVNQLHIRVHVVHAHVTKTVPLDPRIPIYKVCERIRMQIRETDTPNNSSDYGLFLPHEDPKKGLWLDNNKDLEHYLVHNGDIVEYRFRYRWLYIRTIDDTKKKLQVDDSKTVSDLMIMVCTKMGIYNYEEYSLIRELNDAEREKTLTLRKSQSMSRNQDKLEKLKKKLHTDDDLCWLNPAQTLRQQGIEEDTCLLFRRKYFFSDMNVDARDPVQLNLLYIQLKEAILNGAHPINQDEAIQLAGIQAQIQLGNYNADKFRPGCIELREFLPKEYIRNKGIDKKVFAQHAKLHGLTEVEAKVKYCQLCRSLNTYGITFFLVKEKMKGKNKLMPRLLGITKDSVVRVDEKTKEILKTWPLTQIHKWAASPNAFTLDFGEYQEDLYTAQTTEGEPISQLIAGYIDIILKKQKAKDHLGIDGDEESTMYEDNVAPARATIIQHQRTPGPQSAQEIEVGVPGTFRSSAGPDGDTGDDVDAIEIGMISKTIYHGQNSAVRRSESPDRFMAGGTQTYHIQELTPAQRALVSSIQENKATLDYSRRHLDEPLEVIELGDDEASRRWLFESAGASRQKVTDEVGAMSAAVAQIVRSTNRYSTQGEEDDLMMMQQSFRIITVHFPSFVDDVRKVAHFQNVQDGDETKGEGGENLLDASRRLADAFSLLLIAAQPQEGADKADSRKPVLEASSQVGQASTHLLHYVHLQETTFDWEDRPRQDVMDSAAYQDQLLALAKAIANATASMVTKAKSMAKDMPNETDQQNMITSATEAGLATSHMVTCVKVVAPTISQRLCQDQLIEACRDVAHSVEGVVQTTEMSTQEEAVISEMDASAQEVRNAVQNFLNHLQQGGRDQTGTDVAMEDFLSASENLKEETDSSRMVAAARKLAQATALMIASIKTQAEGYTDSEQQSKLLNAAKQLADATAKLVEAAKACSANPQNTEYQVTLKQAAEHLTVITYSSDADALKVRIIRSLIQAARQAVSAGTQLVNTSQNSAKKSRASTFQICSDGKLVADLIPKLVMAIRECRRDPDDPLAQLELISACQEYLEPCEQLVHSSKALCPTVGDQPLQQALDGSLTQLGIAIEELRLILGRCEPMCRYLDLAGALELLARLIIQIQTVEQSARNGHLMPLPDDKIEQSVNQLASSVDHGVASTTHVLAAVHRHHPDDVGRSCRDLASQAAILLQATRGVSAGLRDPESEEREVERRLELITNCQMALIRCHELVKEVKRLQVITGTSNGVDNDTWQDLQQLQHDAAEALSHCLTGLPGHRDIEMTLQLVRDHRHRLAQASPQVQDDTEALERLLHSFTDAHNGLQVSGEQEAQEKFTQAAVELNMSTSEMAASNSPSTFSRSSRRFGGAYQHLVGAGIMLSSEKTKTSHNPRDTTNIVQGLVNVSNTSEHMLVKAKDVCAEPNAPSHRHNFQQAARQVTDSINQLITVCSSSIYPGQRDCQAAIRQIENTRPLLESPVHPMRDAKYYQCLDEITHKTKALADGLRGMSVGTKENNIRVFTDSVKGFADSVCYLVEESTHAAYLVGISDPHSQPGRPALIDHATFQDAYKIIKDCCDDICRPETSHRQDHNLIVASSSRIAHKTKSLCDTCRTVSGWAGNTSAKRHLQQCTQDILQATGDLMVKTRDLDAQFTEPSRLQVEKEAKTVLNAVQELINFVSGHQFAGQPAKITPEAMEAQKPIIVSGSSLIDASINVLRSAEEMIGDNGYDENSHINYSHKSKELSDRIKHLIITIKENAPGQRECAEALRRVNAVYHELQASKFEIIQGRPAGDKVNRTEEVYQKLIADATRQLQASVPTMVQTGKSEPERLGRSVLASTDYLSPLISAILGASSRTDLSQNQIIYTEHARTILEALEQLLQAVKVGGGNDKAYSMHEQIEDMGKGVIESCDDLLNALDNMAAQQGNVTTMVETISKSVHHTQQSAPSVRNETNYADFQSRMIQICKRLNELTEVMVVNAGQPKTLPDLGLISNDITKEYSVLSEECVGGTATLSDQVKARRLRDGTKAVGHASVSLVKASGSVHLISSGKSVDTNSLQHLNENARTMGVKIAELLAILESVNYGTLACIKGASTVSGIIADLDTTIMFASAGTLNPEELEHPQFSTLRESIVLTAKSLVDNTKSLVVGANADQSELAESAQAAVSTIISLADVVKMGAVSLGTDHSQSQIVLVSSVKDVASSLQDLFLATKDVTVRPEDELSSSQMKETARKTVQNVTTLLRTVKSVEDDNQKGTQVLETAIEAIKIDSQSLNNAVSGARPEGMSQNSQKSPSPHELSRHIQPLKHALNLTEGAHQSQEQVIQAAVSCRHSVGDLVRSIKTQSYNVDSQETRIRMARVGKDCADAYVELLLGLRDLLDVPIKDGHTRMRNAARRIHDCLHELGQIADTMKEGPRLVLYFRPHSPEYAQVVQRLSVSSPPSSTCSKPGRDVTEKFIGRHVAYHHHYVKSYANGDEDNSRPGSRSSDNPDLTSVLDQINRSERRLAEMQPLRKTSQDELEATFHTKGFTSDVPSGAAASQENPLEIVLKTSAETNDVMPPMTHKMLEAASNVAASTRHLIEAASASRAAGKSDDPRWAQNVTSKGRLVGEATVAMVETANALVSGHAASEERLVEAAQRVASSTATLLFACKNKTVGSVPFMERLQHAGQDVRKATDSLVKAVQNASEES